MKLGVMIFPTDQTVRLPDLAVEVEQRGFESLWVPEKSHVPTSRRTPWAGGELPDCYKRVGDPLVSLAAAAAVTTTLRLGTGTLLPPIRDAVLTAKAIATLDWLSHGRLELGVGYGWNAEELATHGTDIATARPVFLERLAVMAEIWSSDIASYTGSHEYLAPSWSWPKPVQKPRPPIHIGARATPEVFIDIAAHGDGWLPIEGYGEVIGQIPALRAAFERHDRDPDTAIVTVYSSWGDPALIESYRQAGVDRVVVGLPPDNTALRSLDTHAGTLCDYLSS